MSKSGLNANELKVQEALLGGNFDEAREQLQYGSNAIRPVNQSIFEASLAFAEKDYRKAWRAIAEGLQADCRDYELYVMLGEYYAYARQNLRQAYLCFENALFYCDNEKDREEIRRVLENLSDEGIYVPKAAIVILSYNLLNMTRDCIESIRKTTFENCREIIVIDNASRDGSMEWLRKQKDIKLLCNSENKGFPAACNQGIRLAEADSDIFLLNNDTVMTDNALFWLRMGLYEKERVGSTGSVSNFVSNLQSVAENGKSREFYLDYAGKNNVPSREPYLPKVYLVGYALLIKRTVLDKVGLLDERFSPGNFEDNDICLRIGLEGYSNVLCKNSFIIHWGSQSFGKEPQKYGNLMERNEQKFFEKWSSIRMGSADYWGGQHILISLCEKYCSGSKDNIMVAGTGSGMFLSILREKNPGAHIYGIEQNRSLAQIAGGIAETVWADFDEWKGDNLAETFDIIFVNEKLKYVKNPESFLKELAKMLKKDGYLLCAFTNKKHYSKMLCSPSEAGLFDRREGMKMLQKANLNADIWIDAQVENGAEKLEEILDRLQKMYTEVTREELLAYQWFVVAQKQRTDIQFDNKMAVCIPTYNHPDAVEDVLENCAETYKRYGLDVYYYDSSENEETKRIIETYQTAGYDNLYYLSIDPQMPYHTKIEHVMMMDGISKKYEYMWYLKDRSWCGEKTLKLIYQAMDECRDLIFLDVGHPNSEREIMTCNNANEFYHRCGDYATSMDTTIYNVGTMLKNGFSMEEFRKNHGEHRGFMHFLIIFEQLAKKEKPKICLLSGGNVTICNSQKVQSSWHEERIQVWGRLWIEVNEILPDCYTEKDDVIKRTASLPWLLGDINALIDLHNRGILTPEYYEEIKDFWERVSNIPLELLRLIAYGKYGFS